MSFPSTTGQWLLVAALGFLLPISCKDAEREEQGVVQDAERPEAEPDPPKMKEVPSTGDRLSTLQALVVARLKTDRGGSTEVRWLPPTCREETTRLDADFDEDGTTDVAGIFARLRHDSRELDEEANRIFAVGLSRPNGGMDLAFFDASIDSLELCGMPNDRPEIILERRFGFLCTGELWLFKGGRYSERCISFGNGLAKEVSRSHYDINLSDQVVGVVEDPTIGEEMRVYGVDSEVLKRKWGYGAAPRFVRYVPVNAAPQSGAVLLDGALEEPVWQAASFVNVTSPWYLTFQEPYSDWTGPKDLSFTSGAVWSDEALTVAVRVVDDAVVTTASKESSLAQDHVEVWFDVRGYVSDDDFEFEPRRTPDRYVLQLGVFPGETPDSCRCRTLYPVKDSMSWTARCAWALTDSGYTVEIVIPFSRLRAAMEAGRWDKEEPPFTFGYTVVVSDGDHPGSKSQETLMATSQLSWGDPTTFGTCTLLGKTR